MIKKTIPLPWINQEMQSISNSLLALKTLYDTGMRNGAPETDYLNLIEKLIESLNFRYVNLKDHRESILYKTNT